MDSVPALHQLPSFPRPGFALGLWVCGENRQAPSRAACDGCRGPGSVEGTHVRPPRGLEPAHLRGGRQGAKGAVEVWEKAAFLCLQEAV